MLTTTETNIAPSGKVPVTGTFTGLGVSEPFTPLPGREFYISAAGNFVGSIRLTVQFRGSSVWLPCKVSDTVLFVLSSESWMPVELSEYGVKVRLECTLLTSGQINYRINQ